MRENQKAVPRAITAFYLVLIGNTLSAQNDALNHNDGGDFEQLIELIIEQQEDEGLDSYQLIEDLQFLKRHPINLNRCNIQELEQIPFLLPSDCYAIITHRDETGGFMSILELQAIRGLDEDVVKFLLPFVRIDFENQYSRLNWSNINREGEHELVARYQRVVEMRKGFKQGNEEADEAPSFLGGPERILIRHRFRVQNLLSAGITMEKDAGEAFTWTAGSRGFDFYSAHFFLRDQGPFKQLAIGDFHAQFGQGLAIWSGQAFNQSTGVVGIKRSPQGLLPYAAADENNFLRGAGFTIGKDKIKWTIFSSLNRKDATIEEPDTNLPAYPTVFNSLQTSGIHATKQQLKQKNALLHFTAGQHFKYTYRKLQVGFSALFSAFDGIQTPSTSFYRQYQTVTENALITSLDYQYVFKNFFLFGEQAIKNNGAKAFINGAIVSLDKQVDLSFSHRYYDRHFAHPLSNAIGVQTRVENEQGFNVGLQARLSSKWRLDTAMDLFRFPWLRYRVDGPSEGWSALLQLNYTPNRKIDCYLRFRTESRVQNLDKLNQATHSLGHVNRQSLRFHIGYPINATLSTRTRLEMTSYSGEESEHEFGMMLYQDFIWTPAFPSRIRLKIRFSFFETDGFNSRIYAYEHDLRYSFSVPAFSNQGSRMYGMIDYRISKTMRLSARIAQTYIHGAETIGSGLNEIQGPTITDVRVQLICQF